VLSTKDVGWPFHSILSSVDLMMTKPGYGTIVEAVALQKPVVYVRRYHFADEQSLVDYLHRYGRGVELSLEDFIAGKWNDTLTAARQTAPPHQLAPPPTGATEAASLLEPYLR
jgi:UDP-N-acetylglucosamine:LPS N-acetylglucosamine transferase